MRSYFLWAHGNLLSASREKATSCLFLSVTYERKEPNKSISLHWGAIVSFLEVEKGSNWLWQFREKAFSKIKWCPVCVSRKSYIRKPKTINLIQVTSTVMGDIWNEKSSQQESQGITNKHKPNWVKLEKKEKKKPEKRKASRILENGSISSVLNTVKASFSNMDERWQLELLNLIIKHLAIIIIVHCLTQSSVNECVLKEGEEGRREG